MSRLFESFYHLNRPADRRLLEGQSLRGRFLQLLVSVFMLGGLSMITVYDAVRLHRFDWSGAIVIAALALGIIQDVRLINRRLDR